MTTLPQPHGPLVVRPVSSRSSHAASDRAVARALWQLFRHDMSTVTGELPSVNGRYRSERLDLALDPSVRDREAWLTLAGDQPVGLAVTRALDEPVRVLSGFFVVAAARRHGVGLAAARAVVADRPGHWTVAHQTANEPAVRFWRRVAADLDPGWTQEPREVPGRPDLPPDVWVSFTVGSHDGLDEDDGVDERGERPVGGRP